MATFDFPFHTFSTENPDSSFRVKLGGSYQYSAPPSAPDQRIFKLKFDLLKYFVTNGVIDKTIKPQINMARLEEFYAQHKLYGTFTYPHPIYGNLVCSFNKPLIIPHGSKGADGAIENIELEFIERPGMADSAAPDLIQIQYGSL